MKSAKQTFLSNNNSTANQRQAGKRAWLSVILATLFTMLTFALLPLSNLFHSTPKKELTIRQVETITSKIAPPKFKIKEPKARKKKKILQAKTILKPNLKQPQSRANPKLHLPFKLNLNNLKSHADFTINFTTTPQKNKTQKEMTGDNTNQIFSQDQVDQNPTRIRGFSPRYPFRARHLNIEGYVTVQFTVTTTGTTSDITIIEDKPKNIFNNSVLRTVAAWQFKPGIKDGEPVATRIQITLRFKLEQ